MKAIKEPTLYIHGWRFLQIGLLMHVWIVGDLGFRAFILILLLLILTSLRWRFRLPVWSVLLDVLLCLLLFPYTDIHYVALAIPMFELALRGKWMLSLLLVAGFSLLHALHVIDSTIDLIFWYHLHAFLFGCFSWLTIKSQQSYKREADEQRKARAELERIKMDLLEANHSAIHHAELMERYRISRQLHDHLGHDLTGALLATQAYEYVKDSEEGDKLLAEVRQRLERSTVSLREAVHNVTPTAMIGVERLDYIISSFQHKDIAFYKSGDMLLVSAYMWGLLEACLKEALTNVARHSDATKVKVDLQVTESIVRLSIHDNGSVTAGSHEGSGLRGLKLRARSIGGSLSVNRQDGFLVVCVIPLEKVGGADEATNRR
ncbi:sensor histidine kinase [Paenibacillus camelliae]|uniref:sensor histidine kinase n=1 Tax=Paenibacillus camelliae TaxID=512410 RepID=UPI00203AE0DF|nr:histidine kinase [Paenibacillus camelliae]MCM3633994.1 histidine kinase [Paenibacillus camelliae]